MPTNHPRKLSLRHLPEVLPEASDYSISFQLPTSITQSDDLLAEDSKDFFKGANYSSILATPITMPNEIASLACNQPIPRSFLAGSSLSRQNLQPPPTQLESTGDSCNHAEVQASSRVEQRIRAPRPLPLGNDPQLERKRELPRSRPHPTPLLTNMGIRPPVNIPSSKPSKSTFSERLPVGSHLEASEQLSALSRTHSHAQIMHADTDKGNQEREEYNLPKSKGPRKTSVEKRSQLMSLKDVSQCGTETNQPNGSVGPNGLLKTRTRKKTTSSDLTTSVGKVSGSSVLKEHFICSEEPDDGSAGIDDLVSVRGLSPLLSGQGTAEHFISCGQQLMNTEEHRISLRARRTKGHSAASDLEHLQFEKFTEDSEEYPSNPYSGCNGETDAIINENVGDEDKPLTVSQLSPRKSNATSVLPRENNDISLSPALDQPRPSDRKRRMTFASAECHDQRPHKKGKGSENAISDGIPSIFKGVPTPIFSFPSEEMFPNPTSAASSPVISETTPSSSGPLLNESNTGEEQRDRTARSKSKTTAIATSLSTSSNSKVDRRSGTERHMKKATKGIVKRLRKLSKTSSSVSGGRVLRARSVSASATVHLNILDASAREKQVARLRTRQNAQEKSQGRRPKSPNTVGGIGLGSTSVGVKKDCRVTRSRSSAQTDENKKTLVDCMDPHKREEQRMSRSASSLSSSSSNSNNRNRRLEALLDSASSSLQGSKRAHRKKNTRAVIPKPFQWATEERLKERRKFDEMVKEKEREKEVLMEQQRREREEEEERELRVLRRKMVPKANVVPEWYKSVPKKQKEEETTGLGK